MYKKIFGIDLEALMVYQFANRLLALFKPERAPKKYVKRKLYDVALKDLNSVESK